MGLAYQRRKVKSVTVEYDNGDVETYQELSMYHSARQNYKSGDTKPEQGHTSHEIWWNEPVSQFPKEEMTQDLHGV